MIIEGGKDYKVSIKNNWKYFRSPKANYAFNMNDGFTFTWGESTDEDPIYFPAPTILDCEVTTKCTGINGVVCSFCIPEGTLITLEDGTTKEIQDIKVGDKVKAYKGGYHNVWHSNEVIETYERDYEGDLICIELESGEYIELTPNHPVLTMRGWVEAGDLNSDDDIITFKNANTKIKSISKKPFNGKVYNFACTPDHTYIANNIVVHNCYKNNSPAGHNMTFETFKKIFDILPKSITQIAFGADSTLKSNPDLWKMMEYARANNIIPNITAAQIDDETADNLVRYCGAVSISRYDNKDVCYDSIKRLTDRGMKQVNMHFMIADETYDKAIETLNDIKTDPRLEKLNAIVFLSLKKKGRAVINSYNCLPQEKFNNLVNIAKENNISIGFDTCSAKKAMEVLGDSFRSTVSFCESTLESCYISCDGEYFPCSFMEGTEGWEKGIKVLECQSPEDFINKVWNNPRTVEFRKNLLAIRGCRSCPYYEI